MIRMLSGFRYQTSDGKEYSIPVLYGDMSRQVASIIKDNSENKLPSCPRISVYITDLKMDKTRLADSTHISKVHIRERLKTYNESGEFTGYDVFQGDNYTVERLMPTPYKLSVKADIWTSNTTQKLQILEQILVFFNPSLEIQTTDNFIDWTSLSVVDLTDINFDSRSIPVGVDSEISISTLTFETPIWISTPSKVKRLGIIHDIIMRIRDESYSFETYEKVNISGFNVFVRSAVNDYESSPFPLYYVEFTDPTQVIQALNLDNDQAFQKYGYDISWRVITDMYPGKFKAGYSQIFLQQPNGNEIVGTTTFGQTDYEHRLLVHFDQDTFPTNTVLPSTVYPQGKTTVDAIINPLTFNPRPDLTILPLLGTRYLILEDINKQWLEKITEPNPFFDEEKYLENPAEYRIPRVRYIRDENGHPVSQLVESTDGADAWAEWDLTDPNNPIKVSDFIAKANDIIEWNGTKWEIVLEAATTTSLVYTTNLKTGVQYKFEDQYWSRSFEGEYKSGDWRLML
jgi:hypothetical protein